jgi:hypothetical protein
VPKVEGCELCEAARFTPWHHEDATCWVADCEACDLPMVVWNSHGTDPSAEDLEHMLQALSRAADGLFGVGEWFCDRNMRQIPDHFHAHARPHRWWSGRFAP